MWSLTALGSALQCYMLCFRISINIWIFPASLLKEHSGHSSFFTNRLSLRSSALQPSLRFCVISTWPSWGLLAWWFSQLGFPATLGVVLATLGPQWWQSRSGLEKDSSSPSQYFILFNEIWSWNFQTTFNKYAVSLLVYFQICHKVIENVGSFLEICLLVYLFAWKTSWGWGETKIIH